MRFDTIQVWDSRADPHKTAGFQTTMPKQIKLLTAITLLTATSADVAINEIANKGSKDVCDGEDWIELHNKGTVAVDLGTGYMLFDNKGIEHDNAFIFPSNQYDKTLLPANGFILLCTKQKLAAVVIDHDDDTYEGDNPSGLFDENVMPLFRKDPMSPQFGLSSDDSVTLVKLPEKSVDSTIAVEKKAGQIPSSYLVIDHIALQDTQDGFDISYALDPQTGEFNYTFTPTPGQANVMTRVLSHEETLLAHKQALKEQEALGRQFFDMDEHGYPVEDSMDAVLELKITMDETDYSYMMENQTFELYRPFQSAKLLTVDGKEVASFDSPGRVRPKGQSGLFVATCLGTSAIPFQLEFDHTNSSQTLFGVQRAFLRHHGEDYSFSREWAYYRMLARFGMPYIRARKVTFTINGEVHGFYTLVEAPEQEYVFARNFPDYNPDSFALYKFKSLAKGCGEYTHDMLEYAQTRMDDMSAPPYAFERGEHKKPVITKGALAFESCREQFIELYLQDIQPDIVLAYLRHDEDCSEMLMEEGLIDRDLGTKDWDKKMKRFIADNLGPNKCDLRCENSNMKNEVDVDNWLKMFAFYATTLSLDSPISFNNNYYLAQSGSEVNGGQGGWKIVPYDLNAREAVGCNKEICDGRLVHWSIARPTCESLESNQLVGPLLTDPDLHDRYLEYVRKFVDTIYGNETTWKEINDHIRAIGDASKPDFWSAYGSFYQSELDPPAELWNSGQYPFLAVIKARTADLRKQLAAIDEAKLARGPYVGVEGDNEAWETCADWRAGEYNNSKCENGCKYEGCHVPGWTVESFCDEGTGVCYHGNFDELCYGIPDGERYAGMENRNDGRETFCRLAKGVAVMASECPAMEELSAAIPVADISTGCLNKPWTGSVLLVLCTIVAVLKQV